MEERIVTHKTAKLAKEKGFNWKVKDRFINKNLTPFREVYNFNSDEEQPFWKGESISAPTQTLLQKWLRDIHGIHVNPAPYMESYDRAVTGYYMGEIINSKGEELYPGDDNYATYEEALEDGLKTALEEI